jgi:hypothetical protein
MHSQGRRRDDHRAADSTACCNCLAQSNVARDVGRENPGLSNHEKPGVVGGMGISTQRSSSLRSGGDAAMSDLEFQRELSPDQLREALSLLDGAAGAKPQNLEVGDLSSPEGGDPGVDQASTTMATHDRPSAVEYLQQHTKPLNWVVVTFCGLGLAASAALTLSSGSDRARTPPPPPGIAREQAPNRPPGQLVKSASPERPAANPSSDPSPGGSERRPSTPEVTDPIGYANRDHDQPPVKGAANTPSAIPYAAQTATAPSVATRQAWRDERASRRPKGARLHARAGRVVAAKYRHSRSHWQARAEIKCFLFVCLPW